MGEGREEGRLFINVYRTLQQLEKIAWEELGAEWGQVQAGKGCQENTLEERSGMRAGTSPWLSPKFNSVAVVTMMVEGGKERKEMRVKEWACEGPGLQPPVLRPPCQRGCRVSKAAEGHPFCHFPWVRLTLHSRMGAALLIIHSHLPLFVLLSKPELKTAWFGVRRPEGGEKG